MASECRLVIGREKTGGRSIREDFYFMAPVKLGEPGDRLEGGRLHLILMMASPGVLAGDSFSYDFHLREGAKALITEQSYTKLFNMGSSGRAKREMSVRLEKGASLWYRPCAVVPYQDSDFHGRTEIHMAENSELLWTDIFTAGRVGMGERFCFRQYENRLRVWRGDELIWLDRTRLVPAQMQLDNCCFYREYTHQGTCFYCGNPETERRLLEADFSENAFPRVYAGISRVKKGICIRALAKQSQDLEELFSAVQNMLSCQQLSTKK